MQTSLALLSFASVALAAASGFSANSDNVFDKRNCDGNNCNREITGTRVGLPASSLRQSDCTSFLFTVVTPSPLFSTVYISAPTEAVTVIPSALPIYATQCSSGAAYASACSCWGVTGTVSTAPTPTIIVTSTVGF
ncbi:hypothetical protein SEUCBS139899_005996 [Sporothrix eucalyptigena]|uniref:Uncharacterized protein n=1 Tax=Sporothrix eucalyptigena TaxID=1812306 RepID=A0ABP0CYJ5_9PEZI